MLHLEVSALKHELEVARAEVHEVTSSRDAAVAHLQQSVADLKREMEATKTRSETTAQVRNIHSF